MTKDAKTLHKRFIALHCLNLLSFSQHLDVFAEYILSRYLSGPFQTFFVFVVVYSGQLQHDKKQTKHFYLYLKIGRAIINFKFADVITRLIDLITNLMVFCLTCFCYNWPRDARCWAYPSVWLDTPGVSCFCAYIKICKCSFKTLIWLLDKVSILISRLPLIDLKKLIASCNKCTIEN